MYIQLTELYESRNSRKKIQEEIAEWNKTIAEMTSESEEAEIQRLQEEIKECKAILKCGVCFDRPKEVGFFCFPFTLRRGLFTCLREHYYLSFCRL